MSSAVGVTATLTLLSTGMATAAITATDSPDANSFGVAMVASSGVATSPGTAPTSLVGASFQVDYDCLADDPTTPDVDESNCPTATSTTPMAGFPTQGDSFSIMSTGNALDAGRPNDSGSTGYHWGKDGASIGADVHDYQIAKVDLGPATAGCLAFDFKFLSEEYPEFVNSGYNDSFVAQLNTWNVSVPPGTQTLVAPGDFAAGSGDQISVDAAGPSSMGEAGSVGTTYDASTLQLVARTPVAVGSANTLYLTLLDQGDGVYDSAVFLDNLRYEDIPAAQCKSLALDPFEGGSGVDLPSAPAPLVVGTDWAMQIPELTCSLPPGPIACNGTVTVSVTPPAMPRRADQRRAATPVTLGSVSYSIGAGATAAVNIPISPEGRAWITAARAKPSELKAAAAKWMKKSKKLSKAAKKLRNSNPAKSKKLSKSAAKAKKKAKKLAAEAKTLAASPLGTATVTMTNTGNGASNQRAVELKR